MQTEQSQIKTFESTVKVKAIQYKPGVNLQAGFQRDIPGNYGVNGHPALALVYVKDKLSVVLENDWLVFDMTDRAICVEEPYGMTLKYGVR